MSHEIKRPTVPEFVEKVKPFTGIMAVEYIARTEIDLLRKPVNFIGTNTANMSVGNLLHGNYKPGQVSINDRRMMGLFTPVFFEDVKTMDLYLVVMKQMISLVRGEDKRFALVIDPLVADLPDHPNRQNFMEISTFCDILVTFLSYDRRDYRNIQRVVGGAASRMYRVIENAMSYYTAPVAYKAKSKSKPNQHHLNKSVPPLSVKPENSPNPAMELAFKEAQGKTE